MNRAIAAFVCLGRIVACGGTTFSQNGGTDDGGAEGAGAISADQAAQDAASAYCNRTQACAPAYITDVFGDVPTCTARFKAVLLPVFASNGSSATPAHIEACAQAIPQMSCADLLGRNLPSACATLPGTLADGAPCAADPQCQGTRCKVPANAVCGTCTEPAAAGAACGVDSDCQPAMACVNGTCIAYGNQDALCDSSHPCRPDLACASGSCTAPRPAGVACQMSDECDILHGVFCNPLSSKCESVSFTGTNAACGIVNQGVVLCAGPGSQCAGVVAPSYQGTCSAPAADGAACDATNGPFCKPGAACASGMCQVPDPALCH
jgi:hypothetical protein